MTSSADAETRDWTEAPVKSGARMLALVTDAFGGYGGIAQYNRDFLAAASQSGLFRSILVLPRIAPLPVNNFLPGVAQLRAIKSRLLYALSALGNALRERPHVVFSAHLLHGPLALLLARIFGAKLVSQLHGTEIWEPISRRCRKALEASDLILTVSRDTRMKALAQLRIAPEKVVVVNNTFQEAFQTEDRESARRRFGLGDELVILTVSRLDDRNGYKGHDQVIRQLPQLLGQGLPVFYVVAGVGPDQGRLERLAEEKGVRDKVRFLGLVSADELPALYRAADLFALPSTGEGFGIAFVEAMACGTPAIGLAVGGIPDALGDGSLGVCVTSAEFPQALAKALQNCRFPDSSLTRLVQERFGRDGYARALGHHFRLLLASSEDER